MSFKKLNPLIKKVSEFHTKSPSKKLDKRGLTSEQEHATQAPRVKCPHCGNKVTDEMKELDID